MNSDWNIQAPGHTCRACGQDFSDGAPLYSKLTFDAGGYTRHDYCAICWQEPAKANALSVWRSVFRAPPPPVAEALKKETAETLLRQLMATEDPANGNAIFILAVMLERRRILVERDVQVRDDGVKIRVYEHRKTGESFLIPDPELKLAELTQVQEEVVRLLGWTPPGEQKPPEPAAATDEPANPPSSKDKESHG